MNEQAMTHRTNSILALSLVALTVAYGLFEARTLMQGPLLTVTDPVPGSTLTGALLNVEGSAKNVSRVRVNGRTIALDISGTFSEKLATPEGYGMVVVEAENRFGKKTKQVVDFVGKPSEPMRTASDET
jgi:hypothetical protein